MKRSMLALALCLLSGTAPQGVIRAQEIVKTGLNFGPLPVVAYDADKGLQYGALLNIFNFGDGSHYPNYCSKWYLEASFFTKGSTLLQLMYDDKFLIPGVRWSSAVTANLDKAMDFYGFGGYASSLDWESIAAGKAGNSFIFTPMYRIHNYSVLAKSDLVGRITDALSWEAGLHLSWYDIEAIDRANVNKGKTPEQAFPNEMQTLYEQYVASGVISADEAGGGFTTSLRAGMVYDTRDKEGAPSRGIWAEGHLMLAPDFLSNIGYARYSLTWRQYLPLVPNDVLTLAYRLNYEGTIGEDAPFYALPWITVMGENGDKDGRGGYRTVRGMLRNRVVGLDMALYNLELRWRCAAFSLGKQNIALGLSAFSDGAMATRLRAGWTGKDSPHITFGAGFRFIMNQNFIVAAEYGTPLSHLLKGSPNYNQDGTGAFYINTGYLF